MKKLTAILLCLILALSNTALATGFPDVPFEMPGENDRNPAPAPAVSEAVQVIFKGQTIKMDFDPTADFSFIRNGHVQASFYSYSADGAYLYEMYLTFPDTVTAGSTFTQDDALRLGAQDSCVAFLVSTKDTEDYYLAAQYDGKIYPAGTSYAIRFDTITDTDAGRVFSGTITANMYGEDINNAPIGENLILTDAPFSFTMPTGASTAPAPGAEPSPTPTVRPDMFRI